MFIDNPVGTGFSYVDSNSLLATNNQEVADDLVELMRIFYDQYPKFKTVPLYILCESYGGKMAVDFALTLDKVREKCMYGLNVELKILCVKEVF